MKTRLARWPALLLALTAIAQTNLPANLLVNGGFESPPGINPYQVFGPGFGAMPGWTIESGTVEITAGTHWQTAEGAQSLDLNGFFESIGTIYQDCATVPGQAYKVRFAYAGNPECGLPTLKTANAYWNGQLLTNLSFDITGHSNTNVGWIYYEQTVTARGDSSRIRFQATSPTFCGLTLDDVSVTPANGPPPNECVATQSGLVGWWRAEGNPTDATGNLNGATPYGIGYGSGVVGEAFDFNGSSRRVSVPDSVALKLTNSLTIEGWIFIRSYGGFILFRGDNRPGLDPYVLAVDGQGRLQFHIESLAAAVNLLAPISTHAWQHVAATLDGDSGDMRLFINGTLAAQANTTIRPFQELDSNHDPAVGIGNHGGNFHNFPFDGLIDELAIYHRALSPAEIQAIHAAGSSGKCGGDTNPPPSLAVPVITSFHPVSATVGSTVTLTGTNFSPVAESNIVFSGAVRAPVVSASVDSLTVTVPPGATYAPITLSVSGLVAYAAQPFQPTFAGDGTNEITTASFAPRFDLAGGDGAHRSAIADLDGDGKPDLAVADVYGHTISLFRNVSSSGTLSSGSFAPRVVLPAEGGASDNPYGFIVADVDGDGKPDLVACDRLANHVSVYRNLATPGSLGTNSFAAHMNFSVGADPRYARVADLDGDGRPDIVSANYAANTISILRNIGVAGSLDASSFAPAVHLPAGNGPYDLAIGDLDGDGRPDLAVACLTGPTLLYRNLASPGELTTDSFAAHVGLEAVNGNITLALGDVDGDGKSDVIIGSYQSGTMSVYRNQASPGSLTANSFAPRVDFSNGNWTHTVALGDLNGDGKTDIATVGELDSYLSVYQNRGEPGSFTNGSLAPRVDFGAGWNAWGLSIGDLDGDGRPDLVFCNAYDDTVSIYQNVMPFTNAPPPPTNNCVAPPAGLVSWWRAEDAGATPLLTFDELHATSPGNGWATLPDGYGGLHWNNFGVLNGLDRPASEGYHAGTISPENVAFNRYGDPVSISRETPFTLASASLTAAFIDGLQLRVQGWRGSSLAYENNYTLSTTVPSPINFNYENVDRVTITPAVHSGFFALDNLLIEEVVDVADSAGSNHGTLMNGATFTDGKVGRAFSFDGVDDFVAIPRNDNLDVGDEITIEFWMKADSTNTLNSYQGLVTSDFWGIEIANGYVPGPLGVNFFISTDGGATVSAGSYPDTATPNGGGAVITAGEWYHVAGTYDGSKLQLYINGQPWGVPNLHTGAISPMRADSFVTIGSEDGRTICPFCISNRYFSGLIDEPSIYNRALSPAEILAIYDAGSTGKCAVSNPPPLIPIILAGPVTNSANGHWYYLLDATNWPAAEEIAVSLGGHLATINDAAENNWVFTTFGNFGRQERAMWIGLTDQAEEGNWRWISGDPSTYRNWSPIEPNSGGGYFADEDHALIWHPSSGYPPGSWNDAPSNQLYYAVVEIAPATPSVPTVLAGPITNSANGHWYYLLDATNWPAAEEIAVSLGGHLATINDAAENAWVFSTFGNFGGVERALWIGLNDSAQEGDWQWISGQLASYLNWAPGEPNSGGGYFSDEDHVLIWHPGANAPPGSWNDAPSNQLYYAIVEVVPSSANQPSGPAMRISRVTGTTEGEFGLRFTGEPGQTYFIEATCDWVTWETLGVAADLGNGQFEFVDINAWRYPGRFYRTASP